MMQLELWLTLWAHISIKKSTSISSCHHSFKNGTDSKMKTKTSSHSSRLGIIQTNVKSKDLITKPLYSVSPRSRQPFSLVFYPMLSPCTAVVFHSLSRPWINKWPQLIVQILRSRIKISWLWPSTSSLALLKGLDNSSRNLSSIPISSSSSINACRIQWLKFVRAHLHSSETLQKLVSQMFNLSSGNSFLYLHSTSIQNSSPSVIMPRGQLERFVSKWVSLMFWGGEIFLIINPFLGAQLLS